MTIITCTFDDTTHRVVEIEPTDKQIEAMVDYGHKGFRIMYMKGIKAAPPYPADDTGWISVDDRLPEIFQMVYAFVPMRASNPFSTAIMRYSNSYKSEGNKFLFDGVEIDDDVVTHWMPLPPAPKGE